MSEPEMPDYDGIARSLAPFHSHFLLTGAGFSKSWGAYLAAEIWSVIVSSPEIRRRPKIDDLLHQDDSLNFEVALATVDVLNSHEFDDEDRRVLRQAVLEAFDIQDRIVRKASSDLCSVVHSLVHRFIPVNKTGCLFTLNPNQPVCDYGQHGRRVDSVSSVGRRGCRLRRGGGRDDCRGRRLTLARPRTSRGAGVRTPPAAMLRP